MARALPCFLLVTLVTLWTASARADGEVYVSEGVSFVRLNGDLAQRFGTGGVQVNLAIGYHLDSEWAVELMGRGGWLEDGRDSWNVTNLWGWGVRAKRFHILGRGLRFYGRGGVTENFVEGQGAMLAGFGLEYGMGIQYTARLRALGLLFWPLYFAGVGPKVNVNFWADLGGEFGNVHAGHRASDASFNYRSTAATIGVGIGGRF